VTGSRGFPEGGHNGGPEHRVAEARDTRSNAAAKSAQHSGETLNQIRTVALRFLAELAVPPSVFRVRAGDVSVHVEWSHAAPTGPVPVGGITTGTPEPVDQARHVDAQRVDEAGPDVHYVTAPTVGVFYRAPGPGAAPFVEEGDTVAAGQQIGIVEAMKLMIPVQADQAGRVTKVLKANGDAVEYDERLIALAPITAG
jgi:acetyl-CoA carboxylase biotin carboxyl carrier protein